MSLLTNLVEVKTISLHSDSFFAFVIHEILATVAVLSGGVGLDRSDVGIVGSNPAQGIHVCQLPSVLCCLLQVDSLRRANLLSKETYQMSK
jgi:hypothetical protein